MDTGSSDYVQIKDGDGTDLTTKLSQHYEIGESKLPPPGTSNSNILHVKLHTNGNNYDRRTGWRLEWGELVSAVSKSMYLGNKMKIIEL